MPLQEALVLLPQSLVLGIEIGEFVRGADQARYGRNRLGHQLQNWSDCIDHQHPQPIHGRRVGTAHQHQPERRA